MKINNYSNDEIHIHFNESEKGKVESFKSALAGHEWITQDAEGNLITAPAHKPPPLLPDPMVDCIWCNPEQTSLFPDKLNISKEYDNGIYVQHIAGYSGNYEIKCKMMEDSGFECLRSKRRNGEIWEIWYLYSNRAAKGLIKGMTSKQIVEWLFQNVQCGQVMIEGQRWGLCLE